MSGCENCKNGESRASVNDCQSCGCGHDDCGSGHSGCGCGQGGCAGGKPKPGALPWLILVLVVALGTAALFGALKGQAEAPSAPKEENMTRLPEGKPTFTKKTQEELRKELTPLQYAVTQEGDTERPYTNEYDRLFEPGIYVDITTGEPLFLSTSKFDSGCGWPAFSKPISDDLIREVEDLSYGMKRIEVRSKLGDAHLGHVFTDGPEALGGLRYCINSASLRFIPQADMEKEGYGSWLPLLKAGQTAE